MVTQIEIRGLTFESSGRLQPPWKYVIQVEFSSCWSWAYNTHIKSHIYSCVVTNNYSNKVPGRFLNNFSSNHGTPVHHSTYCPSPAKLFSPSLPSYLKDKHDETQLLW